MARCRACDQIMNRYSFTPDGNEKDDLCSVCESATVEDPNYKFIDPCFGTTPENTGKYQKPQN